MAPPLRADPTLVLTRRGVERRKPGRMVRAFFIGIIILQKPISL
jgi:hypothetical protein